MARDYRALVLDATADALVATTVDGRVEFWNRGATDLFGYSSEEAAGKVLTESHGSAGTDCRRSRRSLRKPSAPGRDGRDVRHRKTATL